MKKKVIKVGTSIGVVFNKQERNIYDIEYGDVLDLKKFKNLKSSLGKKRCK